MTLDFTVSDSKFHAEGDPEFVARCQLKFHLAVAETWLQELDNQIRPLRQLQTNRRKIRAMILDLKKQLGEA